MVNNFVNGASRNGLKCEKSFCENLKKPATSDSSVDPIIPLLQVGPTEGIDMGDDLWVSRFILHR